MHISFLQNSKNNKEINKSNKNTWRVRKMCAQTCFCHCCDCDEWAWISGKNTHLMSSKWNSWDAARDLKTVRRLNGWKAGTSTTVTFTWRVPEKRTFSITWSRELITRSRAAKQKQQQQEMSASQGLMVEKDPAQGQRAATRWGSKWIPVSEDACDSSTVTWETDSAANSRMLQMSTGRLLSLWCYFPLKLTEKWAVPLHMFQVRSRVRPFSLKTAKDCFHLGLTKASFLCRFFILHETVQMRCRTKQWKNGIFCWGCSQIVIFKKHETI